MHSLLLAALILGAARTNAQAEAESTASIALQTELRQVVTSWASAWQSQDANSYLAMYHPRFQFEDFSSRESWEAERRQRITQPSYIRISLKDFVITVQASNAAKVRFWLSYVRDEYGDQTLKELYLVKENGKWSIARESNLEVRAIRRD